MDEASNVAVDMVGGTENAEALQVTKNVNDTIQAQIDDTGAAGQGRHEEHAVEHNKTSVQVFQVTISLRDDCLHQGDALQDMDLETCAENIKCRANTIRGTTMQKILAQPTFAFDAHHKLAPGFMQVIKS